MRTRVFVAAATAGRVEEFSLDEGRLQHAGGFDCADVRTLALDRERGLLHAVGNGAAPTVVSTDVSVAGTPLVLARTALPVTATYAWCDGARLFCASYFEHAALVLPLGPDGLPAGPATVSHPGRHVHCVRPGPDGTRLYAVCLGDDAIVWANDDGRLDWRGRWQGPAGCGPRHLVFGPDGRRAFAVTELTGHLETFDVRDGALHHTGSLDALPGTDLRAGRIRRPDLAPPPADSVWAADVALAGRWAFVSERTAGTVTVIDLAEQRVVDVRATEAQPRALAVDPSGSFLLTAGERSHRLRVERIGDDGRLTVTDASPTGAGPLWIAVW